jgi:hypothetical protein
MRSYLILSLLFCYFGNSIADSTEINKLTYSVDTIVTLYFSDNDCKGCINSNERFPYAFTIDSDSNIYLLETDLKTIRKIDKEGNTVWNHSTAPFQYVITHLFNDTLYTFGGKRLEVRSLKTGEIVNIFKLPINYDSIHNGVDVNLFYMYKNLLYVKYECRGKNNACSILAFDIQNGKLVSRKNCVSYGYQSDKNKKRFWPVPDCNDCLEYLNDLDSDYFEGQSSRYIMIDVPEKIGIEDSSLIVFDKLTCKKYMTDLYQFYSEPWGYGRFRFLSPDIPVTTISEYNKKDGMPYLIHFIAVKFHGQ